MYDLKSPMSFCKWKTHQPKISPHVTQFCLQSCTVIQTKIHSHTLVNKNPPWNPAICLSVLYLRTSIISTQIFLVTIFIKTPHIYENMTIWPRGFTEETVWGNTEESRTTPHEIFSNTLNMHRRILLIHRPTKILNPSHESLFDLLPSDIIGDIDIWLSSLKHRNESNHIISRYKSICTLFCL